jgi:CheY-like chemotaxis protein
MSHTSRIKILIVDDSEESGTNAEEVLRSKLSDLDPDISRVTNFSEGEALLLTDRFDLAILDVRLGEQGAAEDETAGRDVYTRVAKAQWLPVIFWTGVPGAVEDLAQPPLVTVLRKPEIRHLPARVRDALASGIPQFTATIAREVDALVRAFARDAVAVRWGEMSEAERGDVLPHVANRLSAYIRNEYLDSLTLGGYAHPTGHGSSARYYLYPPVTNRLMTGDVLLHLGEWYVLATPQCDLEPHRNGEMKAGYLRLLRTVPIGQPPEAIAYIAAQAGKDKAAAKAVESLLGDHFRYFFLPAYLEIPNRLVDFEQVISVPSGEILGRLTKHVVGPHESDMVAKSALASSDEVVGQTQTDPPLLGDGEWLRVATMDAPFSQALQYRLSRSVSRVGIEVLPPSGVLEELRSLRD